MNKLSKAYNLMMYDFYEKPLWSLRQFPLIGIMELIRRKYEHFNPSNHLFTAIQIQTKTFCNLSCVFCPNGLVERPHGIMPLSLYLRILKELAALKYHGFIELYLMNEPSLDKRMPQLIEMARDKCPKATIKLSTNGTMLTEPMIRQYFSSGLDLLYVNDYRQVQRRAMASDLRIKLSVITQLVWHLQNRKRNNGKIWLHRYPAGNRLTNRSGLVEGIGIPTPLPFFCNRPFERMYIRFDGKALLCCNDWKSQEIMGDIKQSSLLEVWTNQKYHRKRRNLLNRNRTGICYPCDFIGFK